MNPNQWELLQHIIRDGIVLGSFVLLFICFQFNWWAVPLSSNHHVRGWFQHDTDISLPYVGADGTVNSTALSVFVMGLPLLALVLLWVFVDRIFSDNFTYNDIEATNTVERITGIPVLVQRREAALITAFEEQHNTSETEGAALDLASAHKRRNFRNDSAYPFLADRITAQSDADSNAQVGVDSSGADDTSASAARSPSSRIVRWGDLPDYQLNPRVLRPVIHWAHWTSSDSRPIFRKWRFAAYQLFVYLTLILFCVFITTSFKLVVGRLRPDFLDRCQPDYTNKDLIIGRNGWIAPQFADICTGDAKLIQNGRESFPSGHSSSAMTASVFTAILLWKRAQHRCARVLGPFFLPFVVMTVLSAGVIISLSRNWDNRHFATDILAGMAIGVICGAASLLFHVFTPSWEEDATLLQSVVDTSAVSTTISDDEDNIAMVTQESPNQRQHNMPGLRSLDGIVADTK